MIFMFIRRIINKLLINFKVVNNKLAYKTLFEKFSAQMDFFLQDFIQLTGLFDKDMKMKNLLRITANKRGSNQKKNGATKTTRKLLKHKLWVEGRT